MDSVTRKEKHREACRKWREANKDKQRELTQKWSAANPERCRENSRKWDEANKGKKKASFRKWYEKNREKAIENARRWRNENPEKVREGGKKYRTNNSEKVAATRHANYARRSAVQGSWTAEELKARFDSRGNRCAHCGETDKKLTVDHITPLNLGGTNYIHNIQPLCLHCNTSKGARFIG